MTAEAGDRPPRAKSRSRASRRPRKPTEKAAPRARRRRPRALLALLIGLVGAAGLSIGLILVWATRAGPGTSERVHVSFSGEETPHELGGRLAELGLVSSPRLFGWYLDWFAPRAAIAPGPHLLRRGWSPRRLVQCLLRLPSRPVARVTLPEGYTHLQVAERLEASDVAAAAEIRRAALDRAFLAELAISGPSAEGYLFPATYEFFVDAEPRQALRQMAQETRKRLSRLDERSGGALRRLAETRGWTEHQVLTLASLVEREARARDEQALVASVFYNRLDDPAFRPARMLQSDATAAYGCQVRPEAAPSCAAYRGRVTPEMLRDAQNPYNTYRHAGLPAGPIGNPGEGAMLAVLAPARTDYLYFVHDGRGRHRFSRTFEEHRRAIDGP